MRRGAGTQIIHNSAISLGSRLNLGTACRRSLFCKAKNRYFVGSMQIDTNPTDLVRLLLPNFTIRLYPLDTKIMGDLNFSMKLYQTIYFVD